MSATIDIKPETAEKLRSIAEGLNVSVEDLLRTYVPGLFFESNAGSSADRVKDFEAWAERFQSDSPPLPDEAISRSSIYGQN
ncbi:MAG: hypothetical protein AB7O66_13175 [Limisphaerales bacterium]